MEDDQLIVLIKKYLDGQCTPAETQIVEAWYDSQKDEHAVFHKGDPALINQSAVRSLQNIRTKIAEQREAENNFIPEKQTAPLFRNWMTAAASVLIFLIGGLYLYPRLKGRSAIKYNEIVAAKGHVLHITLSDHTSIWLNACSRLKYPQTLDSKSREVYLEGEAYFDVFHDPSKPFKVHTSKLTTTVLGTAFSVTAYQNMPAQAVTVIRGKVQVADDRKVLGLLTPDQRIDYQNSSRKSRFSEVSAASLMSWKDGKLQFEDQDMQDIAARLGRWYGYTFKFENIKMMDYHYTASFNNKIPLTSLLEVMKAVSRVNYKIDRTQQTVTFLGTGCNE